jgi:hypothetical protein
MTDPSGPHAGSVDLYWIPLGAGTRSVRGNGIVYETVVAAVQRRPRCDLYHCALAIVLEEGRFMVEMTPVPDGDAAARGVVAVGPVGVRTAGRFRLFRYEVRRWRDGVVPDLRYAVASPIRVTNDPGMARRVFDVLPGCPPLVWGRDEARTGDMWSCNSIVSWALSRGGLDTSSIPRPPGGRAPGWDAGAIVAHRSAVRGAEATAAVTRKRAMPGSRRGQHRSHPATSTSLR